MTLPLAPCCHLPKQRKVCQALLGKGSHQQSQVLENSTLVVLCRLRGWDKGWVHTLLHPEMFQVTEPLPAKRLDTTAPSTSRLGQQLRLPQARRQTQACLGNSRQLLPMRQENYPSPATASPSQHSFQLPEGWEGTARPAARPSQEASGHPSQASGEHCPSGIQGWIAWSPLPFPMAVIPLPSIKTHTLLPLPPRDLPALYGTSAPGNGKTQQPLLTELIILHENVPTMTFLFWLWNIINEWEVHK